jgi:hypothetical protein
VALDELTRESTVGFRSRAARSVLQNGFPKARRLAQAHTARDHSAINALAEMLAHLRNHLLAKVCPPVKHRHNNTTKFEALVRA